MTTPINPQPRNKLFLRRVRPKIGDELEIDIPDGCDSPPLVMIGARSEVYLLWYRAAPPEEVTNKQGAAGWKPPKRKSRTILRAVT